MIHFKKNKKSIFLILMILLAVGLFFVFGYKKNENEMMKLHIGNEIFKIEVVSSAKDLERGLGGRIGLCQSCGMLFKFSQAGKYSFWMKDMNFPIDILWVRDGKIVHLERNVSPSFMGTLNPDEMADSVFEIGAGKTEKLGLKVGDQIGF